VAGDLGRAAIVVPRRGRRALHLGGELGREVEHETPPQGAQADQAARLYEKARVGAHRWGPGLLVARVLYRAQHLDAPVLRVGALVAQALEGDPHLHLVAPLGHMATRFVHVIRIQVDGRVEPAARARAPGGAGGDAVAPDAVLLHPQWIHREHRGTAVVEIGIEQNGDVVVRVDVVAVGEGGAHRAARTRGCRSRWRRARTTPAPRSNLRRDARLPGGTARTP